MRAHSEAIVKVPGAETQGSKLYSSVLWELSDLPCTANGLFWQCFTSALNNGHIRVRLDNAFQISFRDSRTSGQDAVEAARLSLGAGDPKRKAGVFLGAQGSVKGLLSWLHNQLLHCVKGADKTGERWLSPSRARTGHLLAIRDLLEFVWARSKFREHVTIPFNIPSSFWPSTVTIGCLTPDQTQ